MATTSVSLQEVLSAIGGPLEEQSLWALLRQTTKSLTKALQGTPSRNSLTRPPFARLFHAITFSTERDNVELLITPETTLLFHGGEVKFLRGISGNHLSLFQLLSVNPIHLVVVAPYSSGVHVHRTRADPRKWRPAKE